MRLMVLNGRHLAQHYGCHKAAAQLATDSMLRGSKASPHDG
jgi:hypothetical protein